MTRARRLVEDHISAYGMVPHPDRIKEVIAEQSQQSFDLGFRAAGGIVEPPSPAGTSAAKTPVSSPQSGEGELLREALADAAQCSWCGLWCSKYEPEPPIHDAVWRRLEKLALEQPGRMVRWDEVIAALIAT